MSKDPIVSADDTPLGAVLPFASKDDLPHGWMPFEGQTLTAEEYPALVYALNAEHLIPVWESMGGTANPDQVVLPNVTTYEDANELMFGVRFATPLILAIKVERADPIKGDAAGSDSEVHGSDPDAR